MEDRTRKRLQYLAVLVCLGAMAGIAYMPFISDAIMFDTALSFAAQGALITLLVFGFEIFVAQGPASELLRRASFIAVFFTKVLITTALIVVAYGLGGLTLFAGRFVGETAIQDLARDTGYALAIASVLQLGLMIRTVVGGRVLTNIILGRYHKPLNEERVFMFLDMVGSTALAERKGAVGAYSVISHLFFDVAQETARFGGETYSYIGDEVIVTWPMKRGLEDAVCLRCYFAICDRIESKSRLYQRNFGLVPEFRVGLHGGAVVAGECGDDKCEIVYFGDTINTTARIEQACRALKRPLLISGELLRQMDLPQEYTASSLGQAHLRGRERELELFTVERRSS